MVRPLERGRRQAAHLVPVDVWSVKRHGVERWLHEFTWPVPDAEGHGIAKALDELFIEAVRDAEPERPDLLLACYKLTIECWHVLHAHLVIARIRERGKEPLCDPRSPYFSQFAQQPGGHFSIENPTRFPDAPGWRRLAARVQWAWYDVRNGRLPPAAFRGSTRWPELGSWGYPSSAHRRFASRSGQAIGLFHPTLWAPRTKRRPLHRHPAHQECGDAFVEKVCALAIRHGGGLPGEHLDLLRRIVFQSIDRTAACVAELERRSPAGRSSVLASSLGAPLLKCFSVAARRKGHEVVGFTHGYFFGQSDRGVKSYNEFAVVDRFIAPTRRSAGLLRRLRDKYPLPTPGRMEVQTLESDELSDQWLRLREDVIPDRIKSIMFLGFPLTPQRFQAPYSYWAFQAELLMRAALAARRLGYRTILKRHPDRLSASEGLYDHFFDELITEPFEQTYRQADAFFFSDIGSTTFPFATMTNRPLVVLDRALDGIWEDVRASVETRCRVVEAWYDPSGRLEFDHDGLAAALAEPPRKPNDEFVETYLVPGVS